MPSVDPVCPVESTVETDPIRLGDQGRSSAQYSAEVASGMSVNPFDVVVPNVVRPNPGAALKESQATGWNCKNKLIACWVRPLVKLIAPTVTPLANFGEL